MKKSVIAIVTILMTICLVSCQTATSNSQTEETSTSETKQVQTKTKGEDISAWLKYRADHPNIYLQDIYYCSKDKMIIADSVGVLVYDRQEKQMKYAIDLREIGCQSFDSDCIKTKIKVSEDGETLIVYNQKGTAIDSKIYQYGLESEQSDSKPTVLKVSKKLKEKDDTFQNIKKENKNRWKEQFDQFCDEKQMKEFNKKQEDGEAFTSEHAFVWKDADGKNNTSFFAKQDGAFYLYTRQGKDREIVSEKISWDATQTLNTKLPDVEYQGKDQREKAVYEYLKDKGDRSCSEDTIHVPFLDIYKIVEKEDTVKVYGSFWTEGYYRYGNILKNGCAGCEPGVIHLKKENRKYSVTKMEVAKDGTEFAPSIRKICKDEPSIAEKMIKEEFPDEMKKKNLVEYVNRNHLDIDYYQDDGWDLQELSFDKTIASGYDLSLGIYEKDMAINGADRDEKNWLISNKKISFPQGVIRSISIKDNAKKQRFVNISEDEIRDFIDIIENEDSQEDVMKKQEDNILDDFYGMETEVVYLTGEGEYRVFHISSVGADYHCLTVYADDKENFSKEINMIDQDTKKKAEFSWIHSKQLTKILKSWIGWNDTTIDQLKDVKSITASWQGEEKEIKFTKKQLESFKKILNSEQEVRGEMPETEYYLKCTLEDGKEIPIGLSCYGEIATEGHYYTLDKSNDSDSEKAMKVIREALRQ